MRDGDNLGVPEVKAEFLNDRRIILEYEKGVNSDQRADVHDQSNPNLFLVQRKPKHRDLLQPTSTVFAFSCQDKSEE